MSSSPTFCSILYWSKCHIATSHNSASSTQHPSIPERDSHIGVNGSTICNLYSMTARSRTKDSHRHDDGLCTVNAIKMFSPRTEAKVVPASCRYAQSDNTYPQSIIRGLLTTKLVWKDEISFMYTDKPTSTKSLYWNLFNSLLSWGSAKIP